MPNRDDVKSLIKEARLYQMQGLLAESREKYTKALRYVQGNPKIPNRYRITKAVRERLRSLEQELASFQETPSTPEVSGEIQDVIRRLFSDSGGEAEGAIRGAVALAGFGQYERALEDFHSLLKKRILPVVAAKNILSCLLAFSSPEAAVAQFGQWVSRETLSFGELEDVRSFLKRRLEKKAIRTDLPEAGPPPAESEGPDIPEEDFLPISSVSIRMETGPGNGDMVELDVTFQSGNILSVIVPASRKDLLKNLRLGTRVPDLLCYSPGAVFRCGGTIFGKSRIQYGPKRGNYMLDMTIDEE